MHNSSFSLQEIVKHNPSLGYSLFECGILFPKHAEKTLNQACAEHGLNIEWVKRRLEEDRAWLSLKPQHFKDKSIAYITRILTGVHTHFAERRLPYIQSLIDSGYTLEQDQQPILADLHWLFPLFYEDFIHHMREEEDLVFGYLNTIESIVCRKKNPGLVALTPKPDISLSKLAMHHLEEDDEMRGISEITNQYRVESHHSVLVETILTELRWFERDLKMHGRIENEILFPKGMFLEKSLRGLFKELRNLN